MSEAYKNFVDQNFSIIQEEFGKAGFAVSTTNDFNHIKGWNKNQYRVKTGSKAVSITAKESTPHPIWNQGAPVLDKDGKQIIRRYTLAYGLFHKDQVRSFSSDELSSHQEKRDRHKGWR